MLRNGAWVSIDDWKWAYQGSDMPVHMAIPGKHHQYGWLAENGAAVGLGFLVSSVKRGFAHGTNMTSARQGMEEVFKQLAETNKADGGVAFDRGYTCLDAALLGECPRRVCRAARMTRASCAYGMQQPPSTTSSLLVSRTFVRITPSWHTVPTASAMKMDRPRGGLRRACLSPSCGSAMTGGLNAEHWQRHSITAPPCWRLGRCSRSLGVVDAANHAPRSRKSTERRSVSLPAWERRDSTM